MSTGAILIEQPPKEKSEEDTGDKIEGKVKLDEEISSFFDC